MQRFTQLYLELDQSNRTNDKLDALRRYFEAAPPADAAWAVYFLIGAKIPRGVNSTQLRRWVAEAAGLPEWLVDESYSAVGDLAETIALLLPDGAEDGQRVPYDTPLNQLIEKELIPLRDLPEPERREVILRTWGAKDRHQPLVYNKIITGSVSVGVDETPGL